MYFKLPLSYRHKFDFNPGDLFHLTANADGTILRLVKDEEEIAGQRAIEQEVSVDAA